MEGEYLHIGIGKSELYWSKNNGHIDYQSLFNLIEKAKVCSYNIVIMDRLNLPTPGTKR